MDSQNLEVAEVARLLDGLARQRFYGEVTVKFDAGRVTVVKKLETLKIGHRDWPQEQRTDARKNRGDTHEQR